MKSSVLHIHLKHVVTTNFIKTKQLLQFSVRWMRSSVNIDIIRFNVARGSHLPFHLLSWTQHQILVHNCDICKQNQNRMLDPSVCALCKTKTDYPFQSNMPEIFKSVQQNPSKLIWPKNELIKHIYYTEADQILTFRSVNALYAIADVSNISTILMGRRRHKNNIIESANIYDTGLIKGRGCGTEGYYFDWPKSSHVQCTVCSSGS